jgi:hypothetical protein
MEEDDDDDDDDQDCKADRGVTLVLLLSSSTS